MATPTSSALPSRAVAERKLPERVSRMPVVSVMPGTRSMSTGMSRRSTPIHGQSRWHRQQAAVAMSAWTRMARDELGSSRDA